MMHPAFTCTRCQLEKTPQGENELGYGTNDMGEKVCYDCCAIMDKLMMEAKGKLTLYLTIDKNMGVEAAKITNWPGTLRFDCQHWHVGRHNIAGRRYDVWFKDHNKRQWHGVTYGDNTQLCHCKRVKG